MSKQNMDEPGVKAPAKTGGPKTVWGHAPDGVFTPYTNPESILRKTSMFGVLRVVDGKVVLPQVPPDKVNQYGLLDLDPKDLKPGESIYYPDMLNDLQLTDHYPLLQETAIGTVCTLNLMKQCRKFDDTDTYNNAFNKEEKLEQYQARLGKLADLIIAMVKENGLPLFTLQEAPSGAEGAAFYAKIERETGCKFASDPTSRDRAGLVTLYDPKKLTPGSVVASTKEAKEQTIEFTPIPPVPGKPFYVTNAHWQLPAAPAGVDRMIKALEKANQPGATHGHLFMGDSNLCANSHAVSKLSDANTQGGQVAAHIAAKKTNLQGATSYVEGSLDQSKGGVTTTDIVFASQGMLVSQSTQQSLYVEDASNPFQVAMEKARKDNDGKLDTGVAQLMHEVAAKEAAATAVTATTATTESFDVLKGLDAQEKKKIIEAEMAVAPKNPALAALKITFSDMTVTAQNDEHIIRLKATFPGQNGAADVTKELTITRTASPDGKAVMRNCEGEGLTAAQRYAIIAAASFEERKIAGKTDTTITVAIKNTGQTPGKDGLTDDERALVKAYLAAGYTEVTCGKDKKCYTQADFTVAAAVTVEEKSVQGWRRAANKAEPAVTFDNLMQLATAVEKATSPEGKASALKDFQEAVETYARQRNVVDTTAKIDALPEAERKLASHVVDVVKSVGEIQKKGSDPTTEEESLTACMSKFGDEVNPSCAASATLE